MKLKLSEAAQPINKLEYNIEKNILPKFKEYGITFSNKPTQINKYKYLYNGVGKSLFSQLYLSTTSILIDEWNETNSDIYVADLYGELKINGVLEQLGPLSSSDPSSVDDAMNGINIEDYKIASQEQLEDTKLYEPRNYVSDLKTMTKDEWLAKKKELETELREIEAELHKADEADDDEHYYNLYKYTYKDKRDYYDKVFMPNYPLV